MQGASVSSDNKFAGMAASSSNDTARVQVTKMEAAWQRSGAANKQPRVRLCTDVEEQVKWCIRDHFPTWSQELIHGVEWEGLSLWDRLMRDKAIWNEDRLACPMGGPYFQTLRERYAGGETLESKLQCADGVVPSKELKEAALEAMSRPAKRSRLLQWLSCTSSANQTEMVAVCRWGFA